MRRLTNSVKNAVPTGHPRIWLDAATLASLRTKAQAGSPQWTALRNAANSYLGGIVEYPDGNDYPNLPNIGEGYQGSGYFDPLLNVALAYQIGQGIDDANTSQWGAKGADILEKMSNPAHVPPYNRDSGYGIRFFGVGMALGYDWLYEQLSASLKSQVSGQLNNWVSFFGTSGFGHGHPHGNYFAGYYATKAYAGIATEGDNANATTMWNDFLHRLHRGGAGALVSESGPHTGVQMYYANYLSGGGWSEGWGYGALAAINMGLPSLAAKTAKAIDLIQDPAQPYTYPLDTGMHLIQCTWPSRTYMDDRDTLHDNGNDPTHSFPAAPNSPLFTTTAAMLSRWNHALTPQFHAYAREIRAQNGLPTPWCDLLFWDDAAPEQSYTTLPRSYLAPGLNTATMRSDWTTSAVWGSLRASAYVDYDYAGEQDFDAGGLAIVRGATPFLVHKNFLVMTWPGTPNDESALYTEIYGTGTPRRVFNTFYNGTVGGQIGPSVDASPPPTTKISQYEDQNGYVLVRGSGLQEMYRSTSGVTSWTRDVVYLRPSLFVVYDRTLVTHTTGDQHMNWHFIPTPAAGTPPSAGAQRWDVTSGTAGFVGAMTTLLPTNADISMVNVFDFNKMYRLEVRPSTPSTSMQWLTVFDASSSSAAVALGARLASSDGNASANVTGALLRASATNFAVLFGSGPATETITGTMTCTIPAALTQVVVSDVAASTAYSVSAVVSGGNLTVTMQTGAGFITSSHGVLYVTISATGTVTAGT